MAISSAFAAYLLGVVPRWEGLLYPILTPFAPSLAPTLSMGVGENRYGSPSRIFSECQSVRPIYQDLPLQLHSASEDRLVVEFFACPCCPILLVVTVRKTFAAPARSNASATLARKKYWSDLMSVSMDKPRSHLPEVCHAGRPPLRAAR